MEGIITGIGDKELGKNLIKPEYDAVINDFIIGKNTILEGLVLNGKNLSAGTCILCGYRGIIDTPKELDTTAYVYGEFTLNSIYGGNGEDDFNIVTSNTALNEIEFIVNPTEITSAGTYYLLLYENGVEQIDREHSYPKYSQQSAETDYVGDNVVISETATTPTEVKTITNELGEQETIIATDLHNEYPNRVANTEYVHAQIEREVGYDETQGELKFDNGVTVGNFTLRRKSRYVIGKAHIETSFSNGGDVYQGVVLGNIPENFRPLNDVNFCVFMRFTDAGSTGVLLLLQIQTNGNIVASQYMGTVNSSNDAIYCTFGYQCQIKENNNA